MISCVFFRISLVILIRGEDEDYVTISDCSDTKSIYIDFVSGSVHHMTHVCHNYISISFVIKI